jgi:hypothetical protein
MSRMSTLSEHTFEIENLHERMQQAEELLEQLQISESDADRLGREVDDLHAQIRATQTAVLRLTLETARACDRILGIVEQCSDEIGKLQARKPEQLRITGEPVEIDGRLHLRQHLLESAR